MTDLLYWLRRGVDLLLAPFDRLTPTWSLIAISAISGVIMVLVIGKVSPQRRIARTRARIASAIYEIRLFLDSPRRVLAGQGRLLWGALCYTAYLTPAFIVLGAPLGLLYLHLEARWGLAPLNVGEQVVVVVEHEPGLDGYQIIPEPAPGIELTAPPLVDAARHRVYLRLILDEPGTHVLPVHLDTARVEKRLTTGGTVIAPSRHRGSDLFWAVGLEPPIAEDAGITRIAVDYRAADQRWLGLALPWWVVWLILSTVVALVAKRPLKVEL